MKFKMNLKKIGILLTLIFFTENVFAYKPYNYCKHIYDWRGENIYNVCATNKIFQDGIDYVVQIVDLDNHIVRNFILTNDKEVMNLYEILSGMNIATLEKVIKSTKWEFWFRPDNGWIYYHNAGLY